ncbi:PREDICTED: oxysterol-binding protein-related protein 9-like [Priapulus caudatus]|uniref:Oxysterol-binding protein n=1 Tax=Priapulus caudatus TaxID=37621 RepID=A0ABM1DU57_PRICU|nr:PREDICTED: oxysterol-binding protein-related protein 9-like [Priapulus caudatus]
MMEGPLSKWTNVMKGWQYRWFVLDEGTGLLSYYTSKEKMMRGSRRGCVRLKGAVIGIDDEDDSTFTLTCDDKTFHFQARDGDEREKWIRTLEDTIVRHTHPQSARYLKGAPSTLSSSMVDFDKKMLEADAYLLLLINQIKKLEDRILGHEDAASRSQLEGLRQQSCIMVETIKHSIMMLQIGKANAGGIMTDGGTNLPVGTVRKGVVEQAAEVCEDYEDASTQMPTKQTGEVAVSMSVPSTLTTAPVEQQVRMTSNVPPLSYSSSEDDEFYDADDNDAKEQQQQQQQQCKSPSTWVHGDGQMAPPASEARDAAAEREVVSIDQVNVDSVYDEDAEDDLESLEQHGSIITHLLSQVRIGMDLTKVVLPTFILEKRSLLEMYADFFAHPDLFAKIPDYSEPRDRFTAVVRYYLSAFHAGRKGAVAKKPYNPILGETFRCHFELPARTHAATELVDDGPIPWVTKDNVTFLAEQVSHHPPISAFYAEHYNKRISLNAHIWTKSKFLGLSIGVHMIGQGCLALLDHGEEYIITFPNGYGRSILTVPWVELGGRVTITCAKNKFSCFIDFITKPFYGGKKHRIAAELMENGKKPFMTISGEWNGIMVSKDEQTGETDVFVDTKHMPVIKKRVRPIAQQLPYESRRLWKDVTAALTIKDVDKATEGKFQLEQRQREEAKERRETGKKWETKLFHENGENWIYDSPLQRRLAEKGIPTAPLDDDAISIS